MLVVKLISSFLFVLYMLCMFLLLNISCPFLSRYTLAGVNAVKEVQVTRDMTDCTEKNGPLQNKKNNANICIRS